MANKNRATHSGICQCCLRLQLLPGGLLALHGYQVQGRGQGGMFVGTCPGSSRLPFQLDCEAMKEFIEEAKQRKKKIEDHVVEIQKCIDKDPKYGWLKKRVKNRDSYGYFEYWTEIVYRDGFRGDTEEPCHLSAEKQAKAANESRLSEMNRDIKMHEDFIKDRTEMVDNWKKRPLPPRKL